MRWTILSTPDRRLPPYAAVAVSAKRKNQSIEWIPRRRRDRRPALAQVTSLGPLSFTTIIWVASVVLHYSNPHLFIPYAPEIYNIWKPPSLGTGERPLSRPSIFQV